MWFAAVQSFVSDRPWTYWLSTPPRPRRFRREKRFLPVAVRRLTFAKRFHPLVSFTPLQSSPGTYPPRASQCEAPSLGLPSLFATSTNGVLATGVPGPPRFRPRRFSRPRRFAPPSALWVYFTPLPRPGFSLQGFSLPHSRSTSSVARALSSLAMVPCQQLPTGAASHHLALRAFAPCASPLLARRGLAASPTRSPLGFVPSPGFSLNGLAAPSRFRRS